MNERDVNALTTQQDKKRVRKKKPLYRMIYEEQRQKILDGVYKEGDLLPYERELCALYGVDRVTVRQAMRLLVEDNLIEKRTGVGSFVRGKGDAPEKNEPALEPKRFLYVLPVSALYIETNPESYNAELFQFLQKECSQIGAMLVYMVENDPQLMALEPGQYDGCFVISRVKVQMIDHLRALMPTICINAANPHLSSLVVEDEYGSYMAVKRLIELGHTRIAMVGNSRELYTTSFRTDGYLRALKKAGIEPDPALIAFSEGDKQEVACIEQILKNNPGEKRPTAFFFQADLLAVSGLSVLMRNGLRVPEDVSIIGFNNTAISQKVYPTLTTVDTQRDLLTQEALLLMLRLLGEKQMRRIMITIPALLVERDSTMPLQK